MACPYLRVAYPYPGQGRGRPRGGRLLHLRKIPNFQGGVAYPYLRVAYPYPGQGRGGGG